MAKKYYIANRKQTEFITVKDKTDGIDIQGFDGDVWVVEDNSAGTAWASRVNAVEKTKSEAQVIVDNAHCKDADGNQLWEQSGSYAENGDYSEVDAVDENGDKIPITYVLP